MIAWSETRQGRYYAEHREEIDARRAARYAANAEALRARQAAWREANPGYQAAYAAANPGKIKAKTAAYREANRDRLSAYANSRRVLRAGAPGSHTLEQWLDLLARHDGLCAYCGAVATGRDHVLSLTRGGSDDIENIVPACGSCNSRKRNKPVSEFLSELATMKEHSDQ